MKRLSLTLLAATLAGCAARQVPPPAPPAPPAATIVCKTVSEQEVAGLFERWNRSLQTGDPALVVANYAPRSYLLPTVSNQPRLSTAEKLDYFRYFLANGPVGRVNERFIELGCNTAVDTGLYTFTFSKTGTVVQARYTYTYHWDGANWLITSHHSSGLPEAQYR